MQQPDDLWLSLKMFETLSNQDYPCYACSSRVETLFEWQKEDGTWHVGDGLTAVRCCSNRCRDQLDTAVRHARNWAYHGYVSFSEAFATSILYSYWFRRLSLYWYWCWFGTGRQPCRMQRLFPTARVPRNRSLANDLALMGTFNAAQVAVIVQFTTMV
jgi:hypothetical protein